ncbi:helix-turn-helix domain-containing protein [Caenimonas sedimenti]|nr:AraC family transcriptional regulator [Caenimonas sedimenti]
MQDPASGSACGDPVFERSLLTTEAVDGWRGFPVSWIEASPHEVHAELLTERNALVMIDTGSTQADFHYGKRAMSWEFQPGSIGLFTPGTELRLSKWRWTPTRRVRIDLDAPLPGCALETLQGFCGPTEIEFRDPELTAVVRAMVLEIAGGNANGRLYAESLSLGVALRLQQRKNARYGTARERGKLSGEQLRKVQELIRADLGKDLCLAALARESGFSPAQFVRLFKNTVGCTPYQYLFQARLEVARELVRASDQPLTTIAAETGFASQSHMTSAFAKAFNVRPGEMRRLERLRPQ